MSCGYSYVKTFQVERSPPGRGEKRVESDDLAGDSRNQPPKLTDPLTEREEEILRLLASGWSDRKIAQHLILALETIKWYNKRIYSKLSVGNRTQAAARAGELGLLDASPTQAQTPEAHVRRHNLPAATTPFVGRSLELNDFTNLLDNEDIRLITILAPGGMGKTRVALEIAKSQLQNFSDGVYFIPLAQLRVIDNIIPTVAKQLNIQLSASAEPEAALLNHLRDKKLLIVLDNFEHLLDGANLIAMLLQAAPGIRVIVTSRERLNLRGETVYALGGMALPTVETTAGALTSSAVQLFIQRVQMARAHVVLPEGELEYVALICQQVGGMPLAIELAASLVEVLSPQEIATEIEHSFDILATEMRDMPHRLRSVRAVFDYSWSRLADLERDVYMRLAVFRDGFTREAAQVVAGADLSLLMMLANKSLLQREPDTGRYKVHELLRQYAEEQLERSGTAAATYQAHMTYYTNLMAQTEAHIKGPRQLEAINQIELDFENVRAAWEWAIEQADLDALDRSLETLYWFCNMRGRISDGEALFQKARERLISPYSPGAHPVQRRLLLRFDASGDAYRGQLEQALALARKHDAQSEIAFFLWALGVNAYVSRDFNRAGAILADGLEVCQMLGDDFYVIELCHLMGMCSRFLGQVEDAEGFEKKTRALSRETGNKFALGRALGSQGLLASFDGKDAQAERDVQEALAVRREMSDSAGVAMCLSSLSTMAFYQGDFSKAKVLAEESLELASAISDVNSRTTALNALGWLACVDENYTRARQLCGESLALAPAPTVSFGAQLGLALAACGLEEPDVARQYVQTLLSPHSFYHTSRGLLSCLPVLAVVYAHQNEAERAVEVLALAFTHPRSAIAWMERWPLLNRLRADLEAGLGTSLFVAAWERGTQLSIETIVSEWLGE